MKGKAYHIAFLAIGILLMALAGCSTQRNTAQSRWWHAFNARYNTYYNGAQAYIEGSLEKENGNRDNFTEFLPLYTVANKASRDLGKANYDRAIEKSEKAIHQHSIKRRPVWNKDRRKTARDREWLSRKEYNPFIWKAWMLMGRSQFFEGNFEAAAATFSYMSRLFATQPAIYDKAQAWLAKCYIEQGWTYDAEDVIRNIERDSIHWRAQREWDYTYALYYIHTAQYPQATSYLRKVITHEMRHKQKARLWFLLGQIQAAMGHTDEAYQAFRHVIALNPPYELEFNARISQTEVMARSNASKMIGKLKRIAASDKNKEYLDQVYYALGNIHLARKDTLQAIAAYERGAQKATRNGIEKGVLLTHLGDLYWQRHRFSEAKRCYGEAIGLLDKERKDYQRLSSRSKILDELVPYTETIEHQDSLQQLALMSEADRNAAIDRAVEAYKKKEKEARRLQAEREETGGNNGFGQGGISANGIPSRFSTNQNSSRTPTNQNNLSDGNTWYFYSPLAVAQGKQQFIKVWGKRENSDDWQRSNKSIVADDMGNSHQDEKTPDEGATSEESTITSSENHREGSASEGSPTEASASQEGSREYYLQQIPLTPEQMAESNQLLEEGLLHAGIILKDKMGNLRLSEQMLRRLTDHYPDYEHLDDAYYHLYLLYNIKHQPAIAETYLQRLKQQYPASQWTALLSNPHYAEDARMGEHLEDSLYTATYKAFREGDYERVSTNATLSSTRFPLGANRDKFLFLSGMSLLGQGNTEGCLKDLQTVAEKYPGTRLSELAGMIVNGVKAGRRLHGGKFDLSDVWTRRSEETAAANDTLPQKGFSAERNIPFVFLMAYAPDSVNENQLLFEVAKYNFTSYLVRNFDIHIDEQGGIHRMQITGFKSYDEARQYANALYQEKHILRLLTKARTFVVSEANLPLLGIRLSYDDYSKFYNKYFAPIKLSRQPLLYEPAERVVAPQQESPSSEDGQTDTEGKQQKAPNGTENTQQEDDNQIEIEEDAGKQEDTGIYFDDEPTTEKSPANSPADSDEYYDLEGF